MAKQNDPISTQGNDIPQGGDIEQKPAKKKLHVINLDQIKDVRLMDAQENCFILEPKWKPGDYYIRPCPDELKP